MPYKPRGRGGRRGRPPKRLELLNVSHNPTITTSTMYTAVTTMAGFHKDDTASLPTTATSNDNNKPREERSYKDYFPDLNIHKALPIVRHHGQQTETNFNGLDDVSDLSNSDTSTPTPLRPSTASPPPTLTASSSSSLKKPTTNGITTTITTDDVSGRNAWSFKVIHGSDKEGDTFQALSTRPQQHHTTPSGAVDLSALPKPSFQKVTDDTDDYHNKSKKKKHKDARKAASSKKLRRPRKLRQPKGKDVENDRDTDSEQDTTSSNDDDTEDDDTVNGQEIATFQRPENHYIRYIEPSEEALYDMVEYDMDEQDEAWLQMVNTERKKENLGEVSCSFFENVIDKLEKEWFDLIKHLPKQVHDEPTLPEDSACAICDDGECENSNAIVFCDGCNLAVHQDCYGVPYIPEGQWLCRKCMVSPDKPVSCLFCPNEGGAFKQTNTNKWGHLLCAIWIPEVGVSNSVYMEPIDNIDSIPKSRWKLTCYICKKRHGACIQCDNKHCFTAFHVTCARWARLCMRMKSHGTHYDSVLLKAYCDRHTPRDYREQVNVEKCVAAAQKYLDPKSPRNRGRSKSSFTPRRRYVDELSEDDEDFESEDGDKLDGSGHAHGDDTEDEFDEEEFYKRRRLSQRDAEKHKKRRRQQKKQKQDMSTTRLTPSLKAARAHQHHYSAGAPIAPDYILTRLENIKCVRQATHLRRKNQLIAIICRYWSLKRESRRGAPLLKRLHLEPWTASSTQLKQTEVEKAHRASAMMNLRSDLERVRMLSEQVQKREKQKLERIRRQKEYLEMVLFPVEYIVKPILNQLMEMDKKEFFYYPVTTDVAPDYFEIIDTPMSFSNVIDKFHAHQYSSLDDVETDLGLIWSNCKTYNRSETSYYKLAHRMEETTKKLMEKARQDYSMLDISQKSGTLSLGIDPEIFAYNLSDRESSPQQAIPSSHIIPIPKPEEGKEEGSTLVEQKSKKRKRVDTGVRDGVKRTRSSQTVKQSTTSSTLSSIATRSSSSSSPTSTSALLSPSSSAASSSANPPRRATRSSSSTTQHISLDTVNKLRKERKLRRSLSQSESSLSSASPSSVSATVGESPSPSHQVVPSMVAEPAVTVHADEQETVEIMPSLSPSPVPSRKETTDAVSSTQPVLPPPPPPPSILTTESPALSAATSVSTPSSSSSASSILSSTSSKISETSATRRRMTRSAGSEGLTLPTKSALKNSKVSKEMQKLLWTDSVTKPMAYERGSYKESKTRRAPTGYVYISSSDEDEGEDEDHAGMDKDDSSKKAVEMKTEPLDNREITLFSSNTTTTSTTTTTTTTAAITEDVTSATDNASIPQVEAQSVRPELLSLKKNPGRSSAISLLSATGAATLVDSVKSTRTARTVPSRQANQKPFEKLRTTKPGEIVWAKVPGYPYHPAKISDMNYDDLPRNITSLRTKNQSVLVQFYKVPENHQWGWVRPQDIYKFGDKENDLFMLETAKLKGKQKAKRKYRYNEVLEGFKYVCDLIGMPAHQID